MVTASQFEVFPLSYGTTSMRALTISACCTLAYFATQRAMQDAQSKANAKSPDPPPKSDIEGTETVLEPDWKESLAVPETLSTQQFSETAAPENSDLDALPLKGQKGSVGSEEFDSFADPALNSPVSLLELSGNAPWNQRAAISENSPAPRSLSVRAVRPRPTPVTLAQVPDSVTQDLPSLEPQPLPTTPTIISPSPLGNASDLGTNSVSSPLGNASGLGTNGVSSPVNTGTTSSTGLPANLVSQRSPATSPSNAAQIQRLQSELEAVEQVAETTERGRMEASPALSINNPTGFGADNYTAFVSSTFQSRTRYTNVSDGGIGVGIGLGDARRAVGVELSYTAASFGGSRDFGSGGFNVKVHRQLPNDWAIAAGWNGAVNLGGDNDFENSFYGVASKVIRTRENIDDLFSRVAVSAGVGTGQFRSEDRVADGDGGVGVFGSVAVRVARPVSVIAEWTGQDLGVGVSIAPFKNVPIVITPAVRDIVGAGDGPRFVLGVGAAYKF